MTIEKSMVEHYKYIIEIKEEEQIKVVNIDAPVLQTKEESVTVSKADESESESEDVEEEDDEDVEEDSEAVKEESEEEIGRAHV